MKTSLLIALLASSLTWASSSKDKVMQLLGSIDTPITRAHLDEAGGAQIALILRSLAVDGSTRRLARQRAVAALEFYPSEDSRKTLLTACDDAHAPVRKAAIVALRGEVKEATVQQRMLRALDDSSVVVRKAAIQVLRGHDFARPALERRRTLEKDRHASRLLERALSTTP